MGHRTRQHFVRVLAVGAILVPMIVNAREQAPGRFEALTEREKIQAVGLLVKRPDSIGARDVDETLRPALQDPAIGVRVAVREVIAGLSQMSAAGQAPPSLRLALLPLREPLVAGLRDTEARVRRGGLMAIGSLDMTLEAGGRAALPAETVALFAMTYAADLVPMVRAEVVKTFALVSVPPESRGTATRIVLAALRDQAEVLQFALMGVRHLQLREAIPRVVELLSHIAVNVRMQAAQTIQAFRGDETMRAYLPDVERALAREPDPTTRKTLEAAVRLLSAP